MTSTGWTIPRPISRCQIRLAIVRENRPFSLSVTSFASCARRSDFDNEGSIDPSSGHMNFGVADPAGRLIAAMDLQRLLRDDRGQAVGIVELPAINEAIVASRRTSC